MNDDDWLTSQFEEHRAHLRAVGYRMLGSFSEADDAVQETWLRLSRTDTSDVSNLGGWLTTVTARVCLNVLRSRRTRREDPLDVHVPDPIVRPVDDRRDPEEQAVLADSVGLALLVVLDALPPAERLAFVLHDLFAMPFEEIAPIVDRAPAAARQLASRARRRVRDAPSPDADLTRQRRVVDAFLAASRDGDFEALVAVLDPEVVLRADTGGVPTAPVPGAPTAATRPVHGAAAVAGRALTFARFAAAAGRRLVLVNGGLGVVTVVDGVPTAVMAFTIADGVIAEIDILADVARLRELDLTALVD
jgi:RNA polymerase sigma-70 factor (ECF subfamily)